MLWHFQMIVLIHQTYSLIIFRFRSTEKVNSDSEARQKPRVRVWWSGRGGEGPKAGLDLGVFSSLSVPSPRGPGSAGSVCLCGRLRNEHFPHLLLSLGRAVPLLLSSSPSPGGNPRRFILRLRRTGPAFGSAETPQSFFFSILTKKKKNKLQQ